MAVSGAEGIAKNIIFFTEGFIKHVNETFDIVRKLLDDEITHHTSLTDHTLEDLRKLDHPYAKRHGERGKQLHDPYWEVHKQTGTLASAKSSGVIDATVNGGVLKVTAFVKIDEQKAPHAKHVIFGTSKMIPRPFLENSKDLLKDQIGETIKLRLKNLRIKLR